MGLGCPWGQPHAWADPRPVCGHHPSPSTRALRTPSLTLESLTTGTPQKKPKTPPAAPHPLPPRIQPPIPGAPQPAAEVTACQQNRKTAGQSRPYQAPAALIRPPQPFQVLSPPFPQTLTPPSPSPTPQARTLRGHAPAGRLPGVYLQILKSKINTKKK